MESLVEAFVDKWFDAHMQGRDIPPEELCRDHPELLDQVRAVIRISKMTLSRTADRTPPTGSHTLINELKRFFAPAQSSDEIGRLGEYRLLDLLGEGGMGAVFRAEDMSLGRQVALKVMRPEIAASSKQRQRFLREARNAASLEHDHIILIFRIGEHHNVPFLVMPLLQGETLASRLQREGRIALADIGRIGREVADGLAAAHGRGIIHRDIKPSNLWLESGQGRSVAFRRLRILDFGLAHQADGSDHVSTTGAVLGTPAYMAPEQARGDTVDHRCDLFSLGCVLYQCGSGISPFQRNSNLATLSALATESPPPLTQVNPSIPKTLSDLVARMLEKDPLRRPSSAQEVAMALLGIPGSSGSHFSAGQDATTDLMSAKAHVIPTRPARAWAWAAGGLLIGLGAFAIDRFAFRGAAVHPTETKETSAELTPSPQRDTLSWYQEGLSLRQAGSNAKALDAFRKVLAANPKDPDALLEIGCLELEAKRARSAITAFSQLVEVWPGDLKAQFGLAIAQNLEKDGKPTLTEFSLPAAPDANTLGFFTFLAVSGWEPKPTKNPLPVDPLAVAVAYLRRTHDADTSWTIPKLIDVGQVLDKPQRIEVGDAVVGSEARTRIVQKQIGRDQIVEVPEVVNVSVALMTRKLLDLNSASMLIWKDGQLMSGGSTSSLAGQYVCVFPSRLPAESFAKRFLHDGAFVMIDPVFSRSSIEQTPGIEPPSMPMPQAPAPDASKQPMRVPADPKKAIPQGDPKQPMPAPPEPRQQVPTENPSQRNNPIKR